MAGRDISDRIQPTPTLGYFYTIREGDTLLGVAGRASATSPGAERLEAARIINDAAYNDRFRGSPSKLFPKGQVSFSPRFVAEPNAQAAVDGPAPAGHKLATLWLAAYPGHEPELEPVDDDDQAHTDEPEDEAQPEPPPPPEDRQIIEWEQLHAGLTVKTDVPLTVYLRPETIPVIIIPGIAGSALEPTDDDDRIKNGPGWPVNDIPQMLKLLVRGPRRKRHNLVGRQHHQPNYLRVIGENDPRAAHPLLGSNKHGLLGVAASKYRAFVNNLLDRQEQWDNPAKPPDSPLHSWYFRTPPHCFGYNWTADIRYAGQSLRQFLDQLSEYYRSLLARCDRFILVTHSTGGLVARAALQQDPSLASKIVAVYHNGVPHVGAAEAFFRVKAGFPQDTLPDKLVAWATMRSGNEAAAIFGNIPGGLQLLPSNDYRTNEGEVAWLELHRESAGGTTVGQHPESDCYGDIYKLDLPTVGLIDKRLLDPRLSADPDHEFALFKERVDLVRDFHQDIHGIEYETAYQVVSIGLPTPDRVRLACSDDEEVISEYISKYGGLIPPHRRNRGEFRMVGTLAPDNPTRWYVELLPRDGEGDATVPSTVANGSHSGFKKKAIVVANVPHSDMLADTTCQWAIMESIRTDLDRLIAEHERSLGK